MSEPIIQRRLYDQLDPLQEQIRVLKVLPSSDPTQPIRCELRVVTLESAVSELHFCALSYVWGDTNKKRRIQVNDIDIDITVSLDVALRQFRDDPPETLLQPTPWSGWLWADAICINQADNDEKGHQVHMMGDIYCRAIRVLSWLGAPSEEPEQYLKPAFLAGLFSKGGWDLGAGFALMKRMATAFTQTSDESSRQLLLRDLRSWDQSGVSVAWRGVYALTHALYWTRLWIVQEVSLANRSGHVLLWGRDSLSGPHLIAFNIMLQEAEFTLLDVDRPDTIPKRDWWLFSRMLPNSYSFDSSFDIQLFLPELAPGAVRGLPASLMPLLLAVRGIRCGDPRDAVFAVARVAETAHLHVEVDYNKTAADVYIEYFTRLLSSEVSSAVEQGSFDYLLLSAGVGRFSRGDCPGLPSWMPNMQTMEGGGHVLGVAIKPVFAPSGSPPPLYQDRRTICIRGVEFARMSTIFSVRPTTVSERTDDDDYDDISVAATFYNFAHRYWQRRQSDFESNPVTGIMSTMLAFSQLVETASGAEAIFPLGMDCSCSTLFWKSMDLEHHLSKYLRLRPPSEQLRRLLLDAIPVMSAQYVTEDDSFEALNSDNPRNFHVSLSHLHKKTVFETHGGHLGIGPLYMQDEDQICVLEGMSYPFVLRKQETFWELVGSCFVPDVVEFMAEKIGGDIGNRSKDSFEVFKIR